MRFEIHWQFIRGRRPIHFLVVGATEGPMQVESQLQATVARCATQADDGQAQCSPARNDPGKPAGSVPPLLDDSSSNDQHSQAGESNSDDTTMTTQRGGCGAGAGKIGKTSQSPRWAISKKAKVILEQIYQMERFPSSEMHRRLAEDFEVEPRQVQFWFQNRRQRDSRALKAAQLAPDDADGKHSGVGTTNAQAILEQLRMMNEARHSLSHSSKAAGQMVAAQPYVPGQMLTPMFVPGQMLTGASIVKLPAMAGQMYPGPPHGMPHAMSMLPQMSGMMQHLQPHQLQHLLSQAQQATAQQPIPSPIMQQHMAHMLHLQMPGHVSQLQAYMHHIGQQPQTVLASPSMAQMIGMTPAGSYGSAPPVQPDSDPPVAGGPASAFSMPSVRSSSENNEDVAAATMMGLGLTKSHDSSAREASDSARNA